MSLWTNCSLTLHLSTTTPCAAPRGAKSAVQRSGAPLKTIKARLIGKEGRVRGSMLGKRTDASARSVISPDPEIDVHQVGVPEKIACTLTFPERVTPRNIQALSDRVLIGAEQLLGAATVIFCKGETIDLEHCQDRGEVVQRMRTEPAVVERYLRNNDVVLFNRQPSLHAASMMCHRVVIMPGNTFRLHPAA